MVRSRHRAPSTIDRGDDGAPPPVDEASGPSAPAGGQDGFRESRAGQRTPELEWYLARTQSSFDALALATIWLSFTPFTDGLGSARTRWWIIGRAALSVAFLIDLVVRSRLARHPWRYWRGHPMLVLGVLIPPVRVLFSLRLMGTVFRRGSLARFMFAAGVLAANIAVIVWSFEQASPERDIDTVPEAFWWAIVTVTTTGYGDSTPVTGGGRVFAVALMGLGITTLAVTTAQIASSFQDQDAAQRSTSAAAATEVGELSAKLARIETLLIEQRGPGPSERADRADPGGPAGPQV